MALRIIHRRYLCSRRVTVGLRRPRLLVLPITLVTLSVWLIIIFSTAAASAEVFPDTLFQLNDDASKVASGSRQQDPSNQSGDMPLAALPDTPTELVFGGLYTAVLPQLLTQLTQVTATTRAPPAMLTGYVSCAGRPIPGVTLRAEHLGTGRLYITISDEDGHYALPIAEAGTYAVRAELVGFAGDTLRVEISEGVNSIRLDLSLRIGSAASGTAAAQSASPQDTASESTTFGSAVSGASSGQLARQSNAGLPTESAREVVVVSGKPVQSSEPNDPFLLKSKSHRLLHGTLSYSGENSALNARPYALRDADTTEPDYASHYYSLSLTGPIAFSRAAARNAHTSLSVTYSGSRTASAFSQLAVVPTEQERNGDFSATTVGSGLSAGHPVQIFDPLTGQLFPQSRIPSDRISPVASALLQYFPLPNVAGPGPNYYRLGTNQGALNSFSLGITRAPSAERHDGAEPTGKHRLNWQMGYRTGASELLNVFPLLGGSSENSGWNTNFSHNFNKGPFTSSMRLQTTRSRSDVRSHVAENVAAALGIVGASDDPLDTAVPAIALSHYASLAGISPRLRADRSYEASESMSWTNGQHTLRWGGGFRRSEFDTRSSDGAQGAFVFTGYGTAAMANGSVVPGTGLDLADFLLGIPQRAAVRYFPGKFSFSANSWHAFLNHDWRITGRLSLNIGLRYENVSPFCEAHGRMADLDIAPNFAAVVPVTAGQNGPFSGYFPATIIRTNTNNLLPRVGLAVRVADGTVMRASYGVHYNPTLFPYLAQQLALQPPFSVSQTALGSPENTLNLVNALVAASADPVKNTFASKRDLRQPYAQVWLLELERELPRGVALSLSYTGTKGTHLDMLRAPNRTIDGLRLPDVAPFLWQSDEGSSILHAGSIRVEKSLGIGLWISSSYMFSRSIDNLPTAGGVPQDEQNLRAERALSDFEERHRWELSYSYELPLGQGKTWLRHGVGAALLGNWSWSGALRAVSGNPITPVVLADVSDVSRGTVGSLRPNLTGEPIQLSHPTLTEYFNPAAFALPEPGEYGNAGRNSIPGPGMLTVDMQAKKRFAFEGGHALELGIQATNALNRPQWTGIDAGVNSPSFGQVTAVAPMRRVQFNLRYSF